MDCTSGFLSKYGAVRDRSRNQSEIPLTLGISNTSSVCSSDLGFMDRTDGLSGQITEVFGCEGCPHCPEVTGTSSVSLQ